MTISFFAVVLKAAPSLLVVLPSSELIVLLPCAYDPGPTCACCSSSELGLNRSSLVLNMESPPVIESPASLGSYSPAPGVASFLAYAPRLVCDANALPCFASGFGGSLASYVPGPGASFGTESSARLVRVPKLPLPDCCPLLNDLDMLEAREVLSYGLYSPGSPTSLSVSSGLRSVFDLKAADPASSSPVENTRLASYAPGPGTLCIRSLRALTRCSSMAARFAAQGGDTGQLCAPTGRQPHRQPSQIACTPHPLPPLLAAPRSKCHGPMGARTRAHGNNHHIMHLVRRG